MMSKEPEVRDKILGMRQAAAPQRMSLASGTAINDCYYENIQWIQANDINFVETTSGRLRTSINPDTNKLRVTQNEVTRYVIKATAETHPSNIEVAIAPGLRDSGVDSTMRTQVLEDVTNAAVGKTGYLDCARLANARRSIHGVEGIGLHIRSGGRILGMDGENVSVPDLKVEAFCFHPTRLVLDPAIQHRCLRRHHDVLYEDVWTIHKLKSAFPKFKFDEDKLRTVGELTPHEQTVNHFSGHRLFQRFRDYATTKGARVYQLHVKDETGRFGLYYAAIEDGEGTIHWQNKNDYQSPFGGDGLPLVLLHGHPRSESMWSFGDVHMVKDAQDQLNLNLTWWMRAAQVFTGPQWIVDRRWMGQHKADEDLRHKFHNRVGGIIDGTPKSEAAKPPVLVQPPAPSRDMMEMVDRSSDRMQKNVFRSAMDFGEDAKSHVPYQTTRQYQQNSGQVLGIRVEQDLNAHAQLLTVLLGTTVKHVQMGSASTMAMLREEGFDESDIGVLLNTDADYPTCSLTVRPASIRYRSAEERREALIQAASGNNPAITPSALRRGLADLDMPTIEEDKHMKQEISKAVSSLLRGQPWEVLPLGEYNEWALVELRRALYDRLAARNPQIRQMVIDAILAQEQAAMQETLRNDPQLAAQQMMAAQQAAMAPPQAVEETQPEPNNLGELIDILSSGGGTRSEPATVPV